MLRADEDGAMEALDNDECAIVFSLFNGWAVDNKEVVLIKLYRQRSKMEQ